MRIFLKYFLWLLSFFTLLLFYFLNTSVGHENLGYLVQDYLSKKTYNDIKVHSLNIDKYPHIDMELTVNQTAHLSLSGEIDQYKADMNYHMRGEGFQFNNIQINERIETSGKFVGPFSALLVEGKGKMFDGNITYRFTKIPQKMRDITLSMKGVESRKILKFLDKPLILEGKADIESQFKFFSKYEKQGKTTIFLPHALAKDIFPNIPFRLKSKIEFDDIVYKYEGEADSKIGHLSIEDGVYYQTKKVAQGNYKLKINDLDYLEKFLKHKFVGSLVTMGQVVYDDKGMEVKGKTSTLGGNLSYLYKNQKIDLNLKSVSLEKLLTQYGYVAPLHSDVDGTIHYDMGEKMLLINTELKNTRFKETKITKMLSNQAGIDLLSTVYDKSTFTGGYQHNLLSSELKIDDGKGHLYLTDSKIDTQSNKINSKFEIKMQGQEIYGDIYGTLEEPQVSVDMRRLLKYQMKKKLGSLMGTEKQEELKHASENFTKKVETIELEDIADTAKSIIDGFF